MLQESKLKQASYLENIIDMEPVDHLGNAIAAPAAAPGPLSLSRGQAARRGAAPAPRCVRVRGWRRVDLQVRVRAVIRAMRAGRAVSTRRGGCGGNLARARLLQT